VNTLTTTVLVAVIALLLGGAAGTIIMAVGARGRRLDDDAATAQILADMVELAAAAASPEKREIVRHRAHLIADRWRPDGHLTIPDPVPPATPDYVHRLVDAYGTGDRLDFAGCWVPADVQGRLRAILAGAGEATGPVVDLAKPVGGHDPAEVNAELRELRERFLRSFDDGTVTVLPEQDR
jgi:hypothetical protein